MSELIWDNMMLELLTYQVILIYTNFIGSREHHYATVL